MISAIIATASIVFITLYLGMMLFILLLRAFDHLVFDYRSYTKASALKEAVTVITYLMLFLSIFSTIGMLLWKYVGTIYRFVL